MIDPGEAAGSTLPSREGRRRWPLLVLAVAGPVPATALLVPWRSSLSLTSIMLIELLVVVAGSAVSGVAAGVTSALVAVLLVNYYFVPPFHTLAVERRDNVVALVVFILVAGTVSAAMTLAARRLVSAERSRIEAELLNRIASAPLESPSLAGILARVRDVFQLDGVALVDSGHGGVVALVGTRPEESSTISVDAGQGLRLEGYGPPLMGEDRRLLSRLAAAAARALEAQRMAVEAGRARELAEVDRLRSALLAAVGHDLRTPLAGIKASVSSLRQEDVEWNAEDRHDLLENIEDSADRLTDLVANLLAMSRLQAGALSVTPQPVSLDEVVGRALLGVPSAAVDVRVDDDLLVVADAGLLERVVANVCTNAVQHSPPGSAVRVVATAEPEVVHLAVSDDGPGVPAADFETMFAPFQRLGDRTADGGIGLGLAIARGFTEAMGGTLVPSSGAPGGLTMTITLPRSP